MGPVEALKAVSQAALGIGKNWKNNREKSKEIN
jgi:hypothetical protein